MRIAMEQAKVNSLGRRAAQLRRNDRHAEAEKVERQLEQARRWLQDAKDLPE